GEKLAQPGDFVVVAIPPAGAALLVAPVRRDTVLGEAVHLGGTDLDLQRPAVVGDDDGMQRPVTVGLGARYVVVVLLRDRLPDAVDGAERGVALVDAPRRRPPPAKILDLGEGQAAAPHLAAEAGPVGGPAAQLRLEAAALAFGAQAQQRRLDEVLALDASFLELLRQALVLVGPEEAER